MLRRGTEGTAASVTSPPRVQVDVEATLMQELPNMLLLVVLYMMQGVPLGLTMGSMPFILASKASYTQVLCLL